MQENAGFELISYEYPLIYKRYTKDATVCVAINPTDKKYEVEIKDAETDNVIYSLGERAYIINEKLVIPPMSANYISIDKK